MTLSMPPIRPGRLTRIANHLGVRRSELVTAMWSLTAGAPIAATVVILATVPVPQVPGHTFDPAPATIAPSSAAEPTPSPLPVPAVTAPRRAPRIIAPTPESEPAPRRTAPPTTSAVPTTAPATSVTEAPSTEPSTEPTETSATRVAITVVVGAEVP